MTSRKAVFGLALALSLGGAVTLTPRAALAQSEEELKQARELFQEAYKDEQEQRYEQALDKFRRVAKVKESASVRYRIASVLEAMKHYREAKDAYRALAAMRDSLPEKDRPIAESAAVRAAELDKKTPRLVVTIAGQSPPADTRVTVDGAPVPAGRPIEQDPGEHVVQATAGGMKPFEQRVTLPDNNSEVPATVTFEPDRPTEPPPGGDEHPKKNNTLAYVALGGGGILLATGIILLVAREGAIDDIKTLCPNPAACPRSRESEVRDKEDQANLFLPLGIGFTAVGAAAAGFGVYMLVKKPSGETAPPPPTARVRISPSYVRGGAAVGLSGTF